MPCLVGVLALAFPRVALFLVWFLGGNYLGRAYDHWIWPLLGFLFLPLTTLVFAYGMNSGPVMGVLTPFEWLLVALAAAGDLGIWSKRARGAPEPRRAGRLRAAIAGSSRFEQSRRRQLGLHQRVSQRIG